MDQFSCRASVEVWSACIGGSKLTFSHLAESSRLGSNRDVTSYCAGPWQSVMCRVPGKRMQSRTLLSYIPSKEGESLLLCIIHCGFELQLCVISLWHNEEAKAGVGTNSVCDRAIDVARGDHQLHCILHEVLHRKVEILLIGLFMEADWRQNPEQKYHQSDQTDDSFSSSFRYSIFHQQQGQCPSVFEKNTFSTHW